MEIHCKYDKLLGLNHIIENPKNTNNHPQSQIDLLSKIIDYQGIRHPIIVSKRSGYIVAGHGRLMSARQLGLETYPVVYQNFESEAQEYEFLESDNRLAELAEHDRFKMLDNIKEIPDIKLDMLGIPNLTADFFEDHGELDDEETPSKEKDEKLCPNCGMPV